MSRRRPQRVWGQQPMYVGRTMGDAKPGERETRPGSGRAWGNQWYWECSLPGCQFEDEHGTIPHDDAVGMLDGAWRWAETLQLGLEHMATVHPDYKVKPPRFSVYVVDRHEVVRSMRNGAETIRWCTGTYGQTWDYICIDRPPASDRERNWLEVLATRLRPGGHMWWWDTNPETFERFTVDYVPGPTGAAA